MKVIFLIGSPDVGGGTYVIFQHALKCLEMGDDVTIVTDEVVTDDRLNWHKEAKKLRFINYNDAKKEEFDIAIATWWRTIYELPNVKAKDYFYFVQSIESKFYDNSEKEIKWLCDATYTINLKIITEATWIKDFLKLNYNIDAFLVHNGIRKDIYKLDGDVYEKNGFRILIEGPVDVFFKNVPKTIELARKSNAEEIWLLTSSNISEYPGIDKVFSRVPIEECAKIYRSCDLLVKLSYVEGMFGPPLEMFHCGGTAITYDVTGYDEYIVNNKNALVVKTDDEQGVIESINKLIDNKILFNKLKSGAKGTASKWINWDESSNIFRNTVLDNKKNDVNSYNDICVKTKFLFGTYVLLCERIEKSNRRKIGKLLRNRFPNIYKCYRKVIKKWWKILKKILKII
ncbi:MAG: glycosyltransferase [Malacoplasma sp.]